MWWSRKNQKFWPIDSLRPRYPHLRAQLRIDMENKRQRSKRQQHIPASTMSTLLKRRLQCFYCGNRSSTYYQKNLRQWTCESCDAVNFLDEVSFNVLHVNIIGSYNASLTSSPQNGQITDPPALPTPQQPSRFAQYASRSKSPDLSPQGNDLFCRTCVTNQHFYTQALASYLPPSGDPEYPKYLASLDTYKEGLEKRYPQVCADCAPRINKRLRETTAAARSDHLRRTLEKGQPGRRNYEKGWTWQRVVVFLGGLGWTASLATQCAWHAMALLPVPDEQHDFVPMTYIEKAACMSSALVHGENHALCFVTATKLVWKSIWLGLLVSWWNSKLSRRLSSSGRLQRIPEYIAFQLFIVGIRAFALGTLLGEESILPDAIPVNAVHGLMLILLLVVSSSHVLISMFLSK